jgi:tRNA/tmRNA/rRNA uracil-C5-methylase (TrmA/RlmC/RlmD family)
LAQLDLEVAVEAVADAAQLAWRTKAEFGVDSAGRAGMHPARSSNLVPLESFPLAVAAIEELDLFGRRWPAGSRLTAVAPSASAAFCLVDGKPADTRREEIVRLADGDQVTEYHYELSGRGFWQLHHAAPVTLVTAVMRALGEAAQLKVWDLYAGAGLFSVPLVNAGADLTAIEVEPGAAADLRANLSRLDGTSGGDSSQSVTQPRVLCGKAERELEAALASGHPEAVVVDPPRAGLGAAVTAQLIEAQPGRIVYVACEPSTLARDIGRLAAGGYQVETLEAFDLFPGTHHLEAVASLTRG